MSRYVALIRGINVGKSNALPMKVLTAFFDDAGCSDVRTYIQSGNVVFDAAEELAASLAQRIGSQVAKQLGRQADVSVVVRSRSEYARAVADNPYREAEREPKTVHLGFLEAAPDHGAIAKLDPQRSDSDRFTVLGKHLYLHTPLGLGRSRLTMSFFAKLGTPCTMRNWSTVLRLRDMLEA